MANDLFSVILLKFFFFFFLSLFSWLPLKFLRKTIVRLSNDINFKADFFFCFFSPLLYTFKVDSS